MERQAITVPRSTPMLDNDRKEAVFFLASPHGTLATEGIWSDISSAEEPDQSGHLSKRVMEKLNEAKQSAYGQANPLAVGAIPFDKTKPAQLVIPKQAQWSAPLQFDRSKQMQRPVGSGFTWHEVPAAQKFLSGVNEALEKIREGKMSKIVLSRTLQITSATTIDQAQLLRNLAANNPSGYTFLMDICGKNGHAAPSDLPAARSYTLIGSSPELLVSRKGRHVFANPLAGSAARSSDPIEDQRRVEHLLASPKDLHEHAVVVDAVAQALRPLCKNIEAPDKPSVLQTPTMSHLSSEIRAELIDPETSSLEIAEALHPTPAVCGTPTGLAKSAIKEIEPYDRGLYTGLIGWCDSNGDGEWIVTIRCAQVYDRTLHLFAGAGIVIGSKPEDEWKETSAKFQTMLQAMGIERV